MKVAWRTRSGGHGDHWHADLRKTVLAACRCGVQRPLCASLAVAGASAAPAPLQCGLPVSPVRPAQVIRGLRVVKRAKASKKDVRSIRALRSAGGMGPGLAVCCSHIHAFSGCPALPTFPVTLRDALQRPDDATAVKTLRERVAKRALSAAAEVVRSLDHALGVSLKSGLERFLPDRRLTLLECGGGGHEGPVAQEDAEPADAVAQAAVAEAALWLQTFPPPLLVVRTDEEKGQAKGMHFLMERARLRMAFLRDPCHRDWNDAQLAIRRSSMWGAPCG